MIRTRNADEFRVAFQGATAAYERTYRPLLDEARRKYAGLPPPAQRASVDEALEHHGRCYIINTLLGGLNWRLDVTPEDGLPNLLPEAAVESERSGTRRFLDYLGIERATTKPLLVVEAKRPNAPLPVLATLPNISSIGPPGAGLVPTSVSDTDAMVISRGLSGEQLSGDWSQWLGDLRDYVRSVKAATGELPRRVVMTNGLWLILFLRPEEAFLGKRRTDPGSILVFRTPEEIIRGSAQLFSQLEHQRVLGEAPTLAPVELPFHLAPEQIREAMHGLRLSYEEAKGIYQRSPMIHVAPIVFLRTDYDLWLRVEASPAQYAVPHDANHLPEHLDEVRLAAESLLREICQSIHIDLAPSRLEKHFADQNSFQAQNAIVKLPDDQYWVMTGNQTHYLMLEPSVRDCVYHDYAKSSAAGTAAGSGPVTHRSVDPRSFFYSGESHHCSHRDVALAKSSAVTPENRIRCGSRSGQDGEAFCEIWSFERRLCCRACVFEGVCTKAQVLHLPCQRLVQIEPAA